MSTQTIQTIPPDVLARNIEQHGLGSVMLIDVRTPAEFGEVHAVGAINVPLDQLDATKYRDMSQPVYFICKSGGRAGKACEAVIAAGATNIFSVEGGTDAWVRAGLAVVRGGSKVMSLERQVRIAAGSIVVIGVALGALVHPWLYGISAFVGAGLVFAGVTDTCGMGMLIARMPWNRAAGCSDHCER